MTLSTLHESLVAQITGSNPVRGSVFFFPHARDMLNINYIFSQG